MFFVPMPPPTPVSPRTRELADLLGRVIEEYERHHPAVSGEEVRDAVRLAARSSRAGGPEVARLVIAALAGVLVLIAVITALAVLQRLRGG